MKCVQKKEKCHYMCSGGDSISYGMIKVSQKTSISVVSSTIGQNASSLNWTEV